MKNPIITILTLTALGSLAQAQASRVVYTVATGTNPFTSQMARVPSLGIIDYAVSTAAIGTAPGAVELRQGIDGLLFNIVFGIFQPIGGGFIYDQFGAVLCAAQLDQNTDGYDEIIATSPAAAPQSLTSYFGRVSMLSGFDLSLRWAAVGNSNVQELGRLACMVDDFDGDGLFDVAAYAPSGTGGPVVRLLSGLTGNTITDIPVPSSNYVEMTNSGDFDANGTMDVAFALYSVGSPGQVDVINLSVGGPVVTLGGYSPLLTELGHGLSSAPDDPSVAAKQLVFGAIGLSSSLNGGVFTMFSPVSGQFDAGTFQESGGFVSATGDIDGDSVNDYITTPMNALSGLNYPVEVRWWGASPPQSTLWNTTAQTVSAIARLGDLSLPTDGREEFAVLDAAGWNFMWGGSGARAGFYALANCANNFVVASGGAKIDTPFWFFDAGSPPTSNGVAFIFTGTLTPTPFPIGNCLLYLTSGAVPLIQIMTVPFSAGVNWTSSSITLPLMPSLFGLEFGFQTITVESPSQNTYLSDPILSSYGW